MPTGKKYIMQPEEIHEQIYLSKQIDLLIPEWFQYLRYRNVCETPEYRFKLRKIGKNDLDFNAIRDQFFLYLIDIIFENFNFVHLENWQLILKEFQQALIDKKPNRYFLKLKNKMPECINAIYYIHTFIFDLCLVKGNYTIFEASTFQAMDAVAHIEILDKYGTNRTNKEWQAHIRKIELRYEKHCDKLLELVFEEQEFAQIKCEQEKHARELSVR